MDELERAHHIIIFMIQDMAMPHIAWPKSRVEREDASRLRGETYDEARNIVWPHNRCVFPSYLVISWTCRDICEAATTVAVWSLD